MAVSPKGDVVPMNEQQCPVCKTEVWGPDKKDVALTIKKHVELKHGKKKWSLK